MKLSCIYIFFIAIAGALNMGVSTSFDEEAKRDFPNLYFRAYPNPKANYNTLVSPLALRYLLLATSFVAKKETQAELQTLLYGVDPNLLLKKINLFKDVDDCSVRMFVNEATDVSECVKAKARTFIEYLSYDNKHSSKKINAWISERSKNLIPEINNPVFSKKTSFVTLVHVTYIDELWQKPFVNIVAPGTRIGNHKIVRPMLQQENDFMYAKLNDLGAEAVELPLTNKVKMLVLNPFDQNFSENFVDLKQKLDTLDIRTISSQLQKTHLNLFFPTLQFVKCVREATNAVKNLNITLPFQRQADFSKLHGCAEDSFIESIHQHSRITANLKGLKIGAETDVRFSFADQMSPRTISGDTDEHADDEESSSAVDQNTSKIFVQIKEDLHNLILGRFLYAVIKDDTILFLGTMVKFHNIEEVL